MRWPWPMITPTQTFAENHHFLISQLHPSSGLIYNNWTNQLSVQNHPLLSWILFYLPLFWQRDDNKIWGGEGLYNRNCSNMWKKLIFMMVWVESERELQVDKRILTEKSFIITYSREYPGGLRVAAVNTRWGRILIYLSTITSIHSCQNIVDQVFFSINHTTRLN